MGSPGSQETRYHERIFPAPTAGVISATSRWATSNLITERVAVVTVRVATGGAVYEPTVNLIAVLSAPSVNNSGRYKCPDYD